MSFNNHKIELDVHTHLGEIAGLSGYKLDNFKSEFIKRYNDPKHFRFWEDPMFYSARTLECFIQFQKWYRKNETWTNAYKEVKKSLYGYKTPNGNYIGGLLGKKLMKMLGY